MNVTLAELPVGKWRNLTVSEMKFINDAVADSVKTEDGSFVTDWADSED